MATVIRIPQIVGRHTINRDSSHYAIGGEPPTFVKRGAMDPNLLASLRRRVLIEAVTFHAALVACVSLLSASFAWANEEYPDPDLPVALSVSTQMVKGADGDTLWVGVRADIDSGWHMYWRHPGATGLPSFVGLDVPAPFVSGRIRWPAPTRFEQEGVGVGFGYEGTVVFGAPISIPDSHSMTGSLDAVARVSWAACREICIFHEDQLVIPLAAFGAQTQQKLQIDEWGPRWGEPASGGDQVPHFEAAAWRRRKNSRSIRVVVEWSSAPREPVECFPVLPGRVRVLSISTRTHQQKSTVEIEIGPNSREWLSGLLDRGEPIELECAFGRSIGDRALVRVEAGLTSASSR